MASFPGHGASAEKEEAFRSGAARGPGLGRPTLGGGGAELPQCGATSRADPAGRKPQVPTH